MFRKKIESHESEIRNSSEADDEKFKDIFDHYRKQEAMNENVANKANKETEDVDRIPQCGFRISERCVPTAKWDSIMQNRQYVPFTRAATLANKTSSSKDFVMVGIVHQIRHLRADGVVQWELTDLVRILTLHLVGECFLAFGRGGKDHKKVVRGSIVALINPVLLPNKDRKSAEPALQISRQNVSLEKALNDGAKCQVIKLGECPALGSCSGKMPNGAACLKPCNLDLQEPYCRNCRLHKESEGKKDILHMLGAKKSVLAVQSIERRLGRSHVNDQYIKAIIQGRRPDSNFSSHAPKLGRSFQGDHGSQEVNLSFLPQEELQKAERMIEERALRKRHQEEEAKGTEGQDASREKRQRKSIEID